MGFGKERRRSEDKKITHWNIENREKDICPAIGFP